VANSMETVDDLAAYCREILLDSFSVLRLVDRDEIDRIVQNPDRTKMGELISSLLRSPQALLSQDGDE
jgi:hypothetical protein